MVIGAPNGHWIGSKRVAGRCCILLGCALLFLGSCSLLRSPLAALHDFTLLVLDVTPLPLGQHVDIYEGPKNFMKVVIPRNSRIPLMKESGLTTKSGNQPAIHFSIYEGESSVANENNFLGKVCIEGISPAPWGVPQFDVFFDIDANGILSVSAEEISTGQKKGITINSDRRNFGGIEMVDYADETAS